MVARAWFFAHTTRLAQAALPHALLNARPYRSITEVTPPGLLW
jgi:hypothetical protein